MIISYTLSIVLYGSIPILAFFANRKCSTAFTGLVLWAIRTSLIIAIFLSGLSFTLHIKSLESCGMNWTSFMWSSFYYITAVWYITFMTGVGAIADLCLVSTTSWESKIKRTSEDCCGSVTTVLKDEFDKISDTNAEVAKLVSAVKDGASEIKTTAKELRTKSWCLRKSCK